MRRRHRKRSLAAISLTAALLAASCSDGGDGDLDRSADASSSSTNGSSASPADDSEPPTSAAAEGSDGVVRIGLTGIASIDPAGVSPAAVAEVILADLSYDGLTTIGSDGTVVPALADFAVNADRTVWRFTLRDDATFADGSPVTPQDVVFSIDRLRARAERSLAAVRLDDVVSVTATGERTVDIALDAPSAVLPEVLSSPLYPITDDATIEQYVAGGDQTPNGSGDFSVVIESADRFVFERRRGSGPATVVVDLFADEIEAVEAFIAGDVDWVIAPPDRLGDAIEVGGTDGLVPFHGGLFLGLDAGVAPLEDQRLRRAIALAIDRTAVADAVFGPTAQPLLGIVPTGVPGTAASCVDPCGPEVAEARRIVETEIFPNGQDVPLRLLVDDSPAQIAVAGVLQDQLGAASIEVEISSLDVATYETLVTSGQQQLFLFGSLGVGLTPAGHLPPLFESTSPDNLTGFADPGIDAALAAARSEPIASVRASAWRDIERAVLERVAVVPLAQFRTAGVSRPALRGFVVRADGSLDLSGVSVSDDPADG